MRGVNGTSSSTSSIAQDTQLKTSNKPLKDLKEEISPVIDEPIDFFSNSPKVNHAHLIDAPPPTNLFPYRILDGKNIQVVEHGPQPFTNQTIGHIAQDGKVVGYVQTNPSKHGTDARLIALVNEFGEIAGFGSPVDLYDLEIKTWTSGVTGLKAAPELRERLRQGELKVGPEYFEVFAGTRFDDRSRIGLIQVPPGYEQCAEYFKEKALADDFFEDDSLIDL